MCVYCMSITKLFSSRSFRKEKTKPSVFASDDYIENPDKFINYYKSKVKFSKLATYENIGQRYHTHTKYIDR